MSEMESRLFYITGRIEQKTTLEELSRIDKNLRRYGVDTNDEYGFYKDLNGEIEIRNVLYEQLEAIYRQVFWNLRIKVTQIGEQVFNEDSEEVDDHVIYDESFKPERLTEAWTFVEDYMEGKKTPMTIAEEEWYRNLNKKLNKKDEDESDEDEGEDDEEE